MAEGDKTVALTGQQTASIDLGKAKADHASLIIVRGQPQGKRYILTEPTMVIGRDPTVSLSVNDNNVSRKHAEVIMQGDKVLIKDLGSTNGTVINDKKIEGIYELQKEDMIKVGNTILKYLPKGAMEAFIIGTLEEQANTDGLTKAFNKRYIMELLESEFKRAKALHNDFSIIVLDLDHFKKINDTHGHDAGDLVLKEVSNLVRTKLLPEKGKFGRFGGEEFVILLPETSGDIAADHAENIRATLEKTNFNYEGKRLPVTASIGVAEVTIDVDSSAKLFKLADQAVYQAKNGGRNQVCIGR
jgi:diguanylate cyclase (GGDEF)-like protein